MWDFCIILYDWPLDITHSFSFFDRCVSVNVLMSRNSWFYCDSFGFVFFFFVVGFLIGWRIVANLPNRAPTSTDHSLISETRNPLHEKQTNTRLARKKKKRHRTDRKKERKTKCWCGIATPTKSTMSNRPFSHMFGLQSFVIDDMHSLRSLIDCLTAKDTITIIIIHIITAFLLLYYQSASSYYIFVFRICVTCIHIIDGIEFRDNKMPNHKKMGTQQRRPAKKKGERAHTAPTQYQSNRIYAKWSAESKSYTCKNQIDWRRLCKEMLKTHKIKKNKNKKQSTTKFIRYRFLHISFSRSLCVCVWVRIKSIEFVESLTFGACFFWNSFSRRFAKCTFWGRKFGSCLLPTRHFVDGIPN